MQYQVLARKWRPQKFHEIVGQEHISRTLLNALQIGRVAHAFLFSGPRGSGKTSTARILAKALNCYNNKPGEPCGNCVSCVEITAGNCIDVLEIDAASNTGVDNVRQLIDQARYYPARDRNKIFIIDEVHMLSTAAFNALLKTLEEPPAHVLFIMATTEYHKIPATILSRCQQYSFKLIPYPLILERMRQIATSEGIQISHGALEQVVFSSGGSMRDAMSALDQVIAFSGSTVRDEDVAMLLGLVEPRILSQTVRAIAQNNFSTLLQIVSDMVEAGEDLRNFCRRLLGQLRNLMVLKAGIADPALLGIPESLLPDLREQAELFSREDLLRLFDAFQRIEMGMKDAAHMRFHLEMGLIELAHIATLSPLEDLVAEFTALAGGEGHRQPEIPASPPVRRSTPSTTRPASPVPEHRKRPASMPGKSSAPEPERDVSGETPADEAKQESVPVRDSRSFLLDIAAAVGREALESLLQALKGAQLQGNRVVLDPGTANDFVRKQIKENLPSIAQAASKIVGSKVTVILGEAESRKAANAKTEPDTPPSNEILEKARREPIVRSFLDVFPGPVKAEKIEP